MSAKPEDFVRQDSMANLSRCDRQGRLSQMTLTSQGRVCSYCTHNYEANDHFATQIPITCHKAPWQVHLPEAGMSCGIGGGSILCDVDRQLSVGGSVSLLITMSKTVF